jgi:1,4-alpha-glucan branching enzyme
MDTGKSKPRKTGNTRSRQARTFIFPARPEVREVFLAGEFNEWDPTVHRMVRRKGAFRRRLTLPAGEYRYKFVVDGEWTTDPDAEAVPNGLGTMDSLVRIG